MSFNHLNNEAPGRRYMFVRMEQTERYCTEWRHILATVAREAVSHIPPNENKTHWDYFDETYAKGYRCASWSARSPKALYVDDMQLRGQIDVGRTTPLNNGRPYGNEIRFKPHEVTADNARAIDAFYTRMHKWYDKNKYPYSSDSFLGSLYILSEFLGIKHFLVYAPGVTHSSYDRIENFVVLNFAEFTEWYNKTMEPFFVETAV